jgi:hypothetical protein
VNDIRDLICNGDLLNRAFVFPNASLSDNIKAQLCNLTRAQFTELYDISTVNSTYNRMSYNRGVMVFNATFNNISVILWRSVLLVEETGVSGEDHRHAASH